MARYFVGHLVEGPAADYYHSITADLSRKFGVKYLGQRIPAHLTSFYARSFQQKTLARSNEELRMSQKSIDSMPLHISGFGKFGTDTVFLEVDADQRLMEAAYGALQALSASTPVPVPKLAPPACFGGTAPRPRNLQRHMEIRKAAKCGI